MECLDHPDIEAVIIALPLFLHAPVAAQAMERGLHVLTEKLMARNVAQCKVMSRMAGELKDKNGNEPSNLELSGTQVAVSAYCKTIGKDSDKISNAML